MGVSFSPFLWEVNVFVKVWLFSCPCGRNELLLWIFTFTGPLSISLYALSLGFKNPEACFRFMYLGKDTLSIIWHFVGMAKDDYGWKRWDFLNRLKLKTRCLWYAQSNSKFWSFNMFGVFPSIWIQVNTSQFKSKLILKLSITRPFSLCISLSWLADIRLLNF